MTVIIAIDPGPIHSALVVFDGRSVQQHYYERNHAILTRVHELSRDPLCGCVAVEQVRSYGMAVGAEVFDTVFWSGRYTQACAAPDDVVMVPRLQVKLHLCMSPKANDGNIRAALIDRFGGKDAAIGKKKTPGPLYGISGDKWAALAVAVTMADKLRAAS